MTSRIRRVTVLLTDTVRLAGLDEPVPAGRYEVTTEEEPLGDTTYPAYRRTSAVIYLPHVPGRPGVSQNIELSSSELEMLLASADPTQ
jgi:hypothetical protein